MVRLHNQCFTTAGLLMLTYLTFDLQKELFGLIGFASRSPKFQKYHLNKKITPWKILKKPDDLLIYLHVPKTAGSTYRKLLVNAKSEFTNWYPNKTTHSWNSPGCIKNRNFGGTHCSVAELTNCVEKGFLEGVSENHKDGEDNVKNPRLNFVTVLRHPVDRVISEYFWWKNPNNINHRPCAPAWNREMCKVQENITAWVLSGHNTAHNRQFKSMIGLVKMRTPGWSPMECNNLNGKHDFMFWNRFMSDSELGDSEVLSDSDFYKSSKLNAKNSESNGYKLLNSDKYLLETGLEEIEKNFAFIGIKEDIDESLRLGNVILKSQKKSKKKAEEVNFHANEAKSEIEDDLRKIIENRNYLDMVVYNFAVRKMKVTLDDFDGRV